MNTRPIRPQMLVKLFLLDSTFHNIPVWRSERQNILLAFGSDIESHDLNSIETRITAPIH